MRSPLASSTPGSEREVYLPPGPHRSPSSTSRRNPKVCVVDPRPADYQGLLASEQLHGLRWELVSSGCEALRVAQQEPIAVWVVHWQLADMSGLDLCQMLKSQRPDAVIYLLTDCYRPEDECSAWQAGATLFRPKPIDPAWFEKLARQNVLSRAV